MGEKRTGLGDLMVVGVVVVMVGLCIAFPHVLDVFRGGGHGVVDARARSTLDQIECMVEHARCEQSFEIFFHCLDAPWKSDYQRASYGSSYRA